VVRISDDGNGEREGIFVGNVLGTADGNE